MFHKLQSMGWIAPQFPLNPLLWNPLYKNILTDRNSFFNAGSIICPEYRELSNQFREIRINHVCKVNLTYNAKQAILKMQSELFRKVKDG